MSIIDPLIQIDKYLIYAISEYGSLVFFLMFIVIFIESGVAFFPFLPGDSLLFAAGAIAAQGALNIFAVFFILLSAAILGNMFNYFIGEYLREHFLDINGNIKYINKEHLDKTHEFYAKYGNGTIVISRFVPVVRTIAPFIAGISEMNYKDFLVWNVVGAFMWISILTLGGYFFGAMEMVKNNFSAVIILIVIISVFPIIIEIFKNRKVVK